MRLNILIFNVIFCFISVGLYAQGDFKSEDELKEKAEELFENDQLIEATPLFAQLLSLYPKDPIYNYKYGACLLSTDGDKEKPLKYLQFATTAPGASYLSNYYLGKAYHLNYDFAKAVKQYSKFKNKASSSEKEKFDVDRQIEMCKNGKDLLSKLNEVQVLNKQTISKKDFFRIYDLKGIDGNIIAKPEDFMSKYDKKNGEKSLIYLPNNATEVYYSSYGAKAEAGKDIFKVIKLGNGNWSDPVNLGSSINTPYDEEFAFIHPDGRTLYFASKGHSSMGGYDLFVSTFDNSINDWTAPVNLDFAFSSVDDDVLFVTDENKEFAFFASNRSNSSDKYTVYKVKVERTAADISLIKGSFVAENDVTLKKATITVIDAETNKTVGVYETDANGNYLIEIAKNGGIYEFNIETTNDSPIHSGKVTIPKQSEFEVLGQELKLVGKGDEQILVIKNIFDGTAATALSNSGPKISSELLRKKASLDINLTPEEVLALESSINNSGQNNENLASNSIDSNSEDPNVEIGTSTNNEGSNSSQLNDNNNAIENSEINDISDKSDDDINTSNSNLKNEKSTNSGNSDSNLITENNSTSSGLNSNIEEGSSDIEKSELVAKLDMQKKIILSDLSEYEKALNLSYSEIEEHTNESNRLFEKLEEQKLSSAPEETIAFTEQEAKRYALLAAYGLNFANKLEVSKKELLDQNKLIAEAETKIEEGDLKSTSNLLEEVSVRSEDNKILELVISEVRSSAQEGALLNASKIESLSNKQTSFKNDIVEIEQKISVIEKNNESSKSEESNQKISELSLDKEDLNYQNSLIEKQLKSAFDDEEAIQVKLEQIETLESKWLDGKINDVVYNDYSSEKIVDIKAEVDDFIKNDQLSFNQSGEEVAIAEVGLNNNSSRNLENQNNVSSIEGTISKEANSINQLYENKLSQVSSTLDSDLQNAEKIKILNDWSRELTSILTEKKQSLTQESNDDVKQSLLEEINEIELRLSTIDNSKLELEKVLVENTSNLNNAENLSSIENSSPSNNINSSSVSEVKSSPYTSFELVDDYSYNNQGAESIILAAKQAFVEAEGFGKRAEEVRAEAFNLASIEERNKAFEKATAFEKAGRIKQIEVAENYGLVNASEFDRNKSLIDDSDNYGEDFQSTNLDIAKLLSEEAELYYNKGREIRESLVDNDRISKKEAELQKAYDFEILALRKQDEALNILKIVDTEFAVNPSTELNDVGYSNDIFSSIENSNEFVANQANIEIEKGDLLMKEALQIEDEKFELQAKLAAETDENERLKLSARIEELEREENRLTADATLIYQQANELNGLSKVINPSPAYAAVNKPAKVENLTKVDIETVEVTAQKGEEIKSSQSYIDFTGLTSQREQAIKSAETEYIVATSLTDEKRRLIKEASILESSIATEEDEETKQRLVKSAEIIDLKLSELENDLDSINSIISAQNQIIEATNTKMAIVLNSLSEIERNELLVVVNSELNGTPLNTDNKLANVNSKISNEGANDLESNETSQSIDRLTNLNGIENEVNTDMVVDGEFIRGESNSNTNELEQNSGTGNNGVDIDNNNLANKSNIEEGNLNQATSQDPENSIGEGLATNTGSESRNDQATELDNVSPSVESNGENSVNSFKAFETVTVNEIDNSINTIPRIVKQAIFVKIASNKSAYNVSNPIPVNPSMPEGLVYKVQIGAFRNPIPQNLFKGFAPLMAEKTSSGITRYTAGLFVKESEALNARNEIRTIGYPDAFVVAFLNGKRIGVSQARKTDNSASQLSTINNTSSTNNTKSGSLNNITQSETGSKDNLPSQFQTSEVESVVNSATINGVYFTVQVGVFSKPLPKGKFVKYQPLNVCVLPSDLIRYNSGVYRTAREANELKTSISKSIKDAFIVAYFNGKRISLGEAARLLNQ